MSWHADTRLRGISCACQQIGNWRLCHCHAEYGRQNTHNFVKPPTQRRGLVRPLFLDLMKMRREFLLIFIYFINTALSVAPQIPLCRRMLGSNPGLLRPERIEWFIKEQAILRSYYSAPRPPPPPSPPPSVSKLYLFLSLTLCRRSSLLIGERGEGAGVEPNHATRKKAWASIYISILSGWDFGIGKSDSLTSTAVNNQPTRSHLQRSSSKSLTIQKALAHA